MTTPKKLTRARDAETKYLTRRLDREERREQLAQEFVDKVNALVQTMRKKMGSDFRDFGICVRGRFEPIGLFEFEEALVVRGEAWVQTTHRTQHGGTWEYGPCEGCLDPVYPLQLSKAGKVFCQRASCQVKANKKRRSR